MHQFSVDLFRKLDDGSPIDNLYMLNGHFLDSLRPLFAKGNNEHVLNRMQVVFAKDVSRS